MTTPGGPTLGEQQNIGELMRAITRLEKAQETLRTELTTRLDTLAERATPLDRFADRNTVIQEKIEQLVRLHEQETAQRIVEIAAEEAARKAGDTAIVARLDKEEAGRTQTTRWLLGGVVAAVGTSVWDIVQGGIGS